MIQAPRAMNACSPTLSTPLAPLALPFFLFPAWHGSREQPLTHERHALPHAGVQEPWLIGLLVAELSLLILVLVNRKNSTFMTVVFFFCGGFLPMEIHTLCFIPCTASLEWPRNKP